MPNSNRQQTIWLPTGNPDTTNISGTDFNALGGQPGQLGNEFNYAERVYQRVQLDSGATVSTPTGIPAVNQLLFWKSRSAFIVTNNRSASEVGSSTGAYQNVVAGVLRNAATPGNYIDVLKKGSNISLLDGANTFAAGEGVFAEADSVAAVDRVGVGTAVAFQQVGRARGPSAAGLVSVDVDLIGGDFK